MTHAELSTGYQTAQIAHAVADFARQQPQAFEDWHSNSNYIVVLEAKNEAELENLAAKAPDRCLEVTEVREPDIGDALTAVAFHPSQHVRRFLASLPCVGKGDKRQDRINSLKKELQAAPNV